MLLGQSVKNVCINSRFDIWQRGATFSFPASGSGVYTADRFLLSTFADGGTAPTGIVTRVASDASNPFEYQKYYLRVTNTSIGASLGAASYTALASRVENVGTLSGKKVIVSIWAKSSVPRSLNIGLSQVFGSGGSSTVHLSGQVVQIDGSSVMKRYDSVPVFLPTIAGKVIGANDYLAMSIFFQQGLTSADSHGLPELEWAASPSTVDILKVQITEGEGVADFETAGRTLHEEISLCQRYTEKSYSLDTVPGTAADAGIWNTGLTSIDNGQTYGTVVFQTRKRAVPTVTTYSRGGSVGRVSNTSPADMAASSASVIYPGERSFSLVNSSGGTITSSTGFIGHWIADAEL